ncbi:hypothetical protein K443DRAFT_678546 [Laccaria amethystina LaAM-08-1]|uniref:Uncharacterized protein n=1 Tax=Laccaria amethystina LaAM-08-1 TaxID=1095629 RepID=A0A0C9XIE1_9AGAR|nr:hypothetical protein K443DRAFT_678546 [Laccaria amethystina LaAM-08-1]
MCPSRKFGSIGKKHSLSLDDDSRSARSCKGRLRPLGTSFLPGSKNEQNPGEK